MARLAPRVKLHDNGTVTVSGLHYMDLRNLLNAAGHGHTQHKAIWEPCPEIGVRAAGRRKVNDSIKGHFKRLGFVLKSLSDELGDRLRSADPRSLPVSKKERLEKTHNDRYRRLVIVPLMEETTNNMEHGERKALRRFTGKAIAEIAQKNQMLESELEQVKASRDAFEESSEGYRSRLEKALAELAALRQGAQLADTKE